ncbi:hypothetical protein ABC347_17220 [Sphingomonas sp. 1P06PA]|uniref:hypothetical protein n=1 Tax=Sphingomonas sp. 1P06PA TaxID=554121 RepID=UPI0039A612CD
MLTVSEAQMAAVSIGYRDRLIARLGQFLTDGHPQETSALGPAGLHAFVEQGMAAAARHGMEDEQSVGLYLTLTLLYGPDFAATPEQARLQQLLALDVDGRVKMRWMADHMIAAEERGR